MCPIFRLAKPAYFRYDDNFTSGRDYRLFTLSIIFTYFRYYNICSIKITSQCNIGTWSLFYLKIAFMTGALWAKRGEHDISRGARHEREARDEGKRKMKIKFFSSTRLKLQAPVALRAKYRVRSAWLIKCLSRRLRFPCGCSHHCPSSQFSRWRRVDMN